MERLPGTTRARASCLFLGRSLLLAVGLALLGLVQPHDQLFADRVRLQDDVVAFPIVVRESGSDVEPVIVLLGSLDDRVDPVHLVGLLGHDALSFRFSMRHLLSGRREAPASMSRRRRTRTRAVAVWSGN